MPLPTREETDRRDILVAKNLIEGMGESQAIIQAGYSNTTAYQKKEEIISRSLKTSPMIAALDDIGVDTAFLARTVKRGLKAKKVQRILNKDHIEEFVDIDHATRHRFLETASRLRGEDPAKKTDSQTTETFEQRIRRLRGIMVGQPALPSGAE